MNLTIGTDTELFDPTAADLDIGEEPVLPEPPVVKFQFTAPNEMEVQVRACVVIREVKA